MCMRAQVHIFPQVCLKGAICKILVGGRKGDIMTFIYFVAEISTEVSMLTS